MGTLQGWHAFLLRIFGASALSIQRLAIPAAIGIALSLALGVAVEASLRTDLGFIAFVAALMAALIWYLIFSVEFSFRHAVRLTSLPPRRFRRELYRLIMLHYFVVTIPFVAVMVALTIYLFFKWLTVLVGAIVFMELIIAAIAHFPGLLSGMAGGFFQLYENWVVLASLPFLGVYVLLALCTPSALWRRFRPVPKSTTSAGLS